MSYIKFAFLIVAVALVSAPSIAQAKNFHSARNAYYGGYGKKAAVKKIAVKKIAVKKVPVKKVAYKQGPVAFKKVPVAVKKVPVSRGFGGGRAVCPFGGW